MSTIEEHVNGRKKAKLEEEATLKEEMTNPEPKEEEDKTPSSQLDSLIPTDCWTIVLSYEMGLDIVERLRLVSRCSLNYVRQITRAVVHCMDYMPYVASVVN